MPEPRLARTRRAYACSHDVTRVINDELQLCETCGELLLIPNLREWIDQARRQLFGARGN